MGDAGVLWAPTFGGTATITLPLLLRGAFKLQESMRCWIRDFRWRVFSALVVVLLGPVSLPAPGGGYELTWSSVDGGGGTSSGPDLMVSGTIGQPDTATSSGGDYVLVAGFWAGLFTIEIFADGFESGGLSMWSNAIGEAQGEQSPHKVRCLEDS